MNSSNYFSRWFFGFIVLSLLWLAFTFPFSLAELYTGLVVGAFISLFTAKYFEEFGISSFAPSKILGLLIYIPIILWEIIKANIEVAIIVLSPSLPIEPAIITAKTNLKSDIGKMFLANSITLTPGTLTVDIIKDTYFIHCIKIDKTDERYATESIIGKFEKHLRRFVK